MKKTQFHFFFKIFQKFRKCLETWKRRLWNFPQNLSKKNLSQYFQLQGGTAPHPTLPSLAFTPTPLSSPLLYLRFRRGLRLLHPLQELSPPEPGWKAIDWNSSQPVLVYYWLTFLNQVRFLSFRHFYDLIFKQISQASFFMILTIFWLFIHCEEEKEFCSKIF